MIFLLSLIRLPGTIMHELCHLIIALLTISKVTSFSLIPKIQNRKIVLGSVSVIPSFKGALIFIGLAPILLWIAAYYISFNQIIIINEYVTWIIVIYMLFGGVPSSTDIKSSLSGLLSPSGILILLGFIFFFAYYV